MEVLVLLAILAFITVIGHSIWVTLALIGRKLTGTPRPNGVAAPPSVPTPKPPLRPPHQEVAGHEAEEPIVAEAVESVHFEPAHSRPTSQPAVPVHPLDLPPEEDAEDRSPVADAPQEPRASVGELLAAFMDDKNIRWGEVLSGLLIVGSAVGLVISLWSTLAQAVPYFPALLFMGVTLALYGAGMYTLRRWKLRTTSQGLLTIALLLVPLNFLAGIALAPKTSSSADLYYMAAVVIGLGAFGTMAVSASRALLAKTTWLLPLAVLGTSASQLVIDRLAGVQTTEWQIALLAMVPVVFFVVAALGQLVQLPDSRRITPRRGGEILLTLGLSVFALLMAHGLLVHKTNTAGDWFASAGDSLAAMSISFSLSSSAALACGLLVHRRSTSAAMSAYRVTGTTIVVLASFVMLLAFMFAWPNPSLLLTLGVVNITALLGLAIVGRLRYLHGVALAYAAFTLLLTHHVVLGHLDGVAAESIEVLRALLNGQSSAVLLGFGALTGAATWHWYKNGQRALARVYGLGAGGIAGASLLIALFAGFMGATYGHDGSDWATLVLAINTVAVIVAACFVRRVEVTVAGSVLLLVTLLQASSFNSFLVDAISDSVWLGSHPVLVAFLLHAVVSAGLVVAARTRLELVDHYVRPLSTGALVTSTLSLPVAIWVGSGTLSIHLSYLVTIAAVWLAIAIVRRSAAVFTAFQLLGTICVGFAVTFVCRQQTWWAGNFFDPWHMQWQIGALALWCLLFSLGRRQWRNNPLVQLLNNTTWPAVDRILVQGLVAGVAGLALLGVMPAVTREFYAGGASAPIGLLNSLSAGHGLVLVLLIVGSIAALAIHAIGSSRQLGWQPLAATLGSFVLLVVSHLGPLSETIWRAIGVEDYHLATDTGTWVALALVTVALVAALRERFTTTACGGLFYLASAVPILIAANFDEQFASASALRWGMASAAVIAAVVICNRQAVMGIAGRLGFVFEPDTIDSTTETSRTVVLIQLALPVLALTLGLGIAASVNGQLGGPAAESLFASMGTAVSYAGPLLLLAAAWAYYAIRERVVWFALAAALLVNLAVSSAQLIDASLTGGGGASLLASNMIVTALSLLAWVHVWRRLTSSTVPTPASGALWPPIAQPSTWPLEALAALLVTQVGVMIAWIGSSTFVVPERIIGTTEPWHDWLAYVAVGIATLAGWTYCCHLDRRRLIHVVPIAALALISLLAVSLGFPPRTVNWQSYHALLAGLGTLATAATCSTRVATSLSNTWLFGTRDYEGVVVALERWSAALIGTLVLFAMRGGLSDPSRPWTTAGAVALAMVLTMAHGVRRRSNALAYVSTGLAALATSLVWYLPLDTGGDELDLLHFIEANIAALCLSGLIWVIIDRVCRPDNETKRRFPAVYHSVAVLSLLLVTVLVLPWIPISEFGRAFGANDTAVDLGAVAMLGSLAALLVATLWVPRARYNVAGLHVVGFLACLLGIDWFHASLGGDRMLVAITLVTAGYVLLTSMLWQWRAEWVKLAQLTGVPEIPKLVERTWRWLCPANVILSALVVPLACLISLGAVEPDTLRIAGAVSLFLLLPAVAMLNQERRGANLALFSLLLGAVAVVNAGWSQLSLDSSQFAWLEIAIRATVALAVVAFAYGTIAVRFIEREGTWFPVVRRAAVMVVICTIGTLLWSLGLEAIYAAEVNFDRLAGVTVFSPGMVAQVAVVLVGLAATLVSIALSPGHDPLGLSERGRLAYVYAAEFVLTLTFVHIRFTRPEWFQGYFLPYWPLIIMAIACSGRLIAVWARRANLPVLADPLEKTGAALPLLPAVGFHLLNFDTQVSYSVSLLVVAAFYFVLALVRRRPIYVVAAVISGNAMLWALFQEQTWSFWNHPQLWLIPPALSTLVAAQLNRLRLSDDQLTAIRYCSAAVIYVSSTGEMFMRGVDEHLWPVMVVAGISIVGALIGIATRVRAFLYLGSAFLLLSMVSMVWHASAAINEVWPWWAFGILSGVALLVMFGVFEKKRDDVSRVLDGLRQWEH